ncbi:MAG: hypothetical protein KatS3mg019_2368 [Fimbriimonadales bacterium]|nr:MAG: hypothetical protein KatS3mg019_2368 [Fimbriimonadales bacterium]
MGNHVKPGLDYGVYSYAEAARLLGITPRRVARWADGYLFPLKRGQGYSAHVLKSRSHRRGVLSFPELIELMFVREFVALGVSLPHVRATAEALAQEVGDYPFTRKRVLVGGRELLVRETEHILRRPDIGQLIADFTETLATQIEIEDDHVRRYYPPQYARQVYLDRAVRGGEPVVSEHAVPTRIIYALWEQEHNLERVADYFELPMEAVSAAIRYEGEWRLSA